MILLTGGSGLLGTELQKYLSCHAPSSKDFDITQFRLVDTSGIDLVIHCAAYTDVTRAEVEREICFKVNVEGTKNLVEQYPYSKFVYISSDYAHNPVNFYSWTKLWGEEFVKKHQNYLIIRTCFKPNPFPYEYAFVDQYTQGDYVDIVAPMIVKEILKDTEGTIDIGTGRKTMFELARITKPDIKGISVDDIKSVRLPKDYL